MGKNINYNLTNVMTVLSTYLYFTNGISKQKSVIRQGMCKPCNIIMDIDKLLTIFPGP